jgi:hypothetical protein
MFMFHFYSYVFELIILYVFQLMFIK